VDTMVIDNAGHTHNIPREMAWSLSVDTEEDDHVHAYWIVMRVWEPGRQSTHKLVLSKHANKDHAKDQRKSMMLDLIVIKTQTVGCYVLCSDGMLMSDIDERISRSKRK